MLFPLIPALSMPKLIAEARQKAGTPKQVRAASSCTFFSLITRSSAM